MMEAAEKHDHSMVVVEVAMLWIDALVLEKYRVDMLVLEKLKIDVLVLDLSMIDARKA